MSAPDIPQTRPEIAAALRDLSIQMLTIGAAMDYYGGMGEIGQHGRELINAATIASEWAAAIEAEQEASE